MKKFKAGDTVFVVPQKQRHGQQEPFQTTIVRTGKKYGYIVRYSQEVPFHLDSGKSHHSDSNSRSNGFGFDVYETEQAYIEKQHAEAEHKRLKDRMTSWGQLKPLPGEAVRRIHAVLDEFSA